MDVLNGKLELASHALARVQTAQDLAAIPQLLDDSLIGHAGLTVFDDSADMLKQARFAMEFCAIESCGKCTPCRIGAVRGVETIDRIARGDASGLPILTDLCNTMKSGSLCALGGFTPYPVMSALTHFPDDFARAKEAAE